MSTKAVLISVGSFLAILLSVTIYLSLPHSDSSAAQPAPASQPAVISPTDAQGSSETSQTGLPEAMTELVSIPDPFSGGLIGVTILTSSDNEFSDFIMSVPSTAGVYDDAVTENPADTTGLQDTASESGEPIIIAQDVHYERAAQIQWEGEAYDVPVGGRVMALYSYTPEKNKWNTNLHVLQP